MCRAAEGVNSYSLRRYGNRGSFFLFVCFLFSSFCHSSRGDSLGATFAGQPAQRKNGQQQLASPGRILSAREKDLEKSPQIQEAFQEPHYYSRFDDPQKCVCVFVFFLLLYLFIFIYLFLFFPPPSLPLHSPLPLLPPLPGPGASLTFRSGSDCGCRD